MRQTWLVLLVYTARKKTLLIGQSFVNVTQNKLYFRINDSFSVCPEIRKIVVGHMTTFKTLISLKSSHPFTFF